MANLGGGTVWGGGGGALKQQVWTCHSFPTKLQKDKQNVLGYPFEVSFLWPLPGNRGGGALARQRLPRGVCRSRTSRVSAAYTCPALKQHGIRPADQGPRHEAQTCGEAGSELLLHGLAVLHCSPLICVVLHFM